MSSVPIRDHALAIRLLAETLYDFMPGPKGASFRKLAGKGKGASHYEPCLECGGSWREGEVTGDRAGFRRGKGVFKDRFKRDQPCESCGGYRKDDGTIVAGEGRIGVDRMTGSRVGTEHTYAEPGRDSWPCNFCTPLGSPRDVKRGLGVDVTRRDEHGNHPRCEPCNGTGTRTVSRGIGRDVKPADPADVTLSAIEQGIKDRNEAGDYHELEVCLAELARRSPHRHKVFHGVHVVKTYGQLSETETQVLRQAFVDLEKWMRAACGPEIRVPREVMVLHKLDPDGERAKASQHRVKGKGVSNGQLAERDREILRRYRTGEATREIAAAFALSESQVQRVLNKVA